jgi:hypothetical protein
MDIPFGRVDFLNEKKQGSSVMRPAAEEEKI